MNIKVDSLIKEFERYKGKNIIRINIVDINLCFELEGISKIEIDNAWCVDENEECNEVTISLMAFR